jgi:hypothetical protein
VRIFIVRDDAEMGFFEWADGAINRTSDPCPITGLEMAERLGLKRATIEDLSRTWQITRLDAAVALFAIEDEGADAFTYEERKWESVASSGRSRDDAPATEREDPAAKRREAMAARLGEAPTTKEDLARTYGVSDRTIDGDLDAIGAVTREKDGRKPLWTMPTDEVRASQ